MTPTKQLGRNGPLVPSIGFGAMSIGGAYGPASNHEDTMALLSRAHEIGARFWDTADIYGEGYSESEIGEWFKLTGKRDDIFLATKFAMHFDMKTFVQSVYSDPEYVKAACERSLKRLGVETIDLYYCHRVDGKTPIEKTIEAMVELKNQGKIKYLGLSEVSSETIRRAHAIHPISAVQTEYSPFCIDIEAAGILATCRELGIAVVAYSPVGRGLLTGTFKSHDDLPQKDLRRMTPKYSKENFPKILELVGKIEGVAKKKACTVAQAGLAWVAAQEGVIPLPGTKTIKYLEENAGAADVKLSDEEVEEIRRYVEETEITGDRYPAMMMGPIFGNTPRL